MRDLANEAGVSFATPFNQFGSKAGVMHALSAKRIATATQRFADKPLRGGAADRLLLAVATVIELMLEEPQVNRAVMGWLGTVGPTHGEVLKQSTALWSMALGEGDGLIADRQAQAVRELPRRLAFGFRGVLSFWTAGELAGEDLAASARDIACALLLHYAPEPSKFGCPNQNGS